MDGTDERRSSGLVNSFQLNSSPDIPVAIEMKNKKVSSTITSIVDHEIANWNSCLILVIFAI